MKFLKWTFIILIVLSLGFFGAGLIQPEQEIEFEMEINKPVMQVYTNLLNPLIAQDWMVGLQSVEQVSGIPGFPGSELDLVFEENGEQMILHERFVKNIPGKGFTIDYSGDVMEGTIETTLEKSDGGTILHFKNNYAGNNFFWRSMMVFFSGQIEQRNRENYERFKKLVENGKGV